MPPPRRLRRRTRAGPVAERAVIVDAGASAATRADFEGRVDRRRLRARDVDADAADHRVAGKAVAGQFRPALAAVGGLPQAAARAAAVEAPRRATALIRRRDKYVRIRRVHHDVGEAGFVVDELGVRPGLAAVAGLVEAALGVRSEQMPDRRDVGDVRILRVHDDPSDALCFLQPDVRKVFPPSADLNTPAPNEELCRLFGSPVPT